MIRKKWNEKEMEKRFENLKKVISPTIVEMYYMNALYMTNNHLDALYIAYYNIKAQCLKYKREVFGQLNQVDYEPKVMRNDSIWYSNGYSSLYNNSFDYYSLYNSLTSYPTASSYTVSYAYA